jgi:hypothetical protein
MQLVPEEERFYKNICVMGEAIHECVSKLYGKGYKTVDPQIILLALEVMSVFDKNFLIRGFIENSHSKCWNYIQKRDEVYFVQNSADIFKYLPMDKINLFKDLFLTKDETGASVVPQALKDQIWSILDAMVKISIKYVHKNRKPSINPKGEKVYLDPCFFNDLDLEWHAKNWGVLLVF